MTPEDPARSLRIRWATPADAPALLEHLRALSEEPDVYLLRRAEALTLTGAQEEEIVAEFASEENSIYLVAERGGRLCGTVTCRGGRRPARRHCAELHISVKKDERGSGVGRALLRAAADWAAANPLLRRLELVVDARNAPGIRLDASLGFLREGVRRSAVCHDGVLAGDWLMARLF